MPCGTGASAGWRSSASVAVRRRRKRPEHRPARDHHRDHGPDRQRRPPPPPGSQHPAQGRPEGLAAEQRSGEPGHRAPAPLRRGDLGEVDHPRRVDGRRRHSQQERRDHDHPADLRDRQDEAGQAEQRSGTAEHPARGGQVGQAPRRDVRAEPPDREDRGHQSQICRRHRQLVAELGQQRHPHEGDHRQHQDDGPDRQLPGVLGAQARSAEPFAPALLTSRPPSPRRIRGSRWGGSPRASAARRTPSRRRRARRRG